MTTHNERLYGSKRDWRKVGQALETPRCPPSHVRRLVKLDCPLTEITRITGYTAEQIKEMAQGQ
jgi:hypothetical protein